jgi:F0F1-type ATP synthase delta subunit
MAKLNMTIVATEVVKLVEDKTPAQISAIMKEVVSLLSEQDALGRWRELEAAFHKAWKTIHGASKITIVSAHELTKAASKALDEQANGAEVVTIVDNRLIGGAVIRLDNSRLDGSITGSLMRLKNAMYTEV